MRSRECFVRRSHNLIMSLCQAAALYRKWGFVFSQIIEAEESLVVASQYIYKMLIDVQLSCNLERCQVHLRLWLNRYFTNSMAFTDTALHHIVSCVHLELRESNFMKSCGSKLAWDERSYVIITTALRICFFTRVEALLLSRLLFIKVYSKEEPIPNLRMELPKRCKYLVTAGLLSELTEDYTVTPSVLHPPSDPQWWLRGTQVHGAT